MEIVSQTMTRSLTNMLHAYCQPTPHAFLPIFSGVESQHSRTARVMHLLSLSLFLASTNRFSLYFQVKIVIAVSARVQFDVFDGIETHGFERHVSFNRKRFLPPLFSLFRTVRKLFTDSLIFIVKYTVRYEYGISRISFSSVKVLVASR